MPLAAQDQTQHKLCRHSLHSTLLSRDLASAGGKAGSQGTSHMPLGDAAHGPDSQDIY